MNELLYKSSLINCPCPICGGLVKLKHTDIVVPMDSVKKRLNENIYYRGACHLFIESISAICKLHGIPMETSVGIMAKRCLEKFAEIIAGKPHLIYFYEVRCSDCDFIIKRYYTTDVDESKK